MNYQLNTYYFLSTEGYKFKYRLDKYNPLTTHVEMFQNGEVVHKQMAKSKDYNVDLTHHEIINTLEALITLKELDPTGLKQMV